MAEHSVIILLLAVCFFLGSSDGRTLENKVSNVRKLADAINATNPKDVQGLAALVLQFQALALIDGSDDPCLPTKWTWIDCSNDASPRVTALYLSNQNLFGFLPDFSTMVALETIDMDNNLLTGSIPSFLGTLPNLKELNLANNLFSGQVPASILQNKKLNTDLTGNPALFYQTPEGNSPGFGDTSETPYVYTTRRKKRSKLPAIIGSTSSVFVVFWVVVGAIAMFRHKAKTAEAVAQATAPGQNAGANKHAEITEETPINAQSGAANP
nr:probable LRR receptor-like serine/threonine-protein kinase At5g16900 isoform X1 [Coffea arabica]